MNKIALILSVFLAFTFILPLSAQRNRGKNPFIRELNAVREYKERLQNAKKERAKKRYQERLKIAEKELADALKEELKVLDEYIKKEELKMVPYKKNIEKLEAEKKRLKTLAGLDEKGKAPKAPAAGAEKGKEPAADDDGVIADAGAEKESVKKDSSKDKKKSKKKKNKKK